MSAPCSYPRLLLTVAVVLVRELCRAAIDICDAIEPEIGVDIGERCPTYIPDALLVEQR